MENTPQILWRPSPEAISQSQMLHFLEYINTQHHLKLKDYFALHEWSIKNIDKFWLSIWEFMRVIGKKSDRSPVFITAPRMQETRWFPETRLNFAENLLQYRDDKPALIYRCETGEKEIYSYADLYQQVSSLADWLRHAGVMPKDRVAGWLPNSPETVIAMLATASIGAVWTACSMDFGIQGILDRFGQIEPKILFTALQHTYGGKTFNHTEEINRLQQELPSLQNTIIVGTEKWQDCVSKFNVNLNFEQLPFDHPLYILYSSGTTGRPKCMVHGAGGTLLQHLKELRLHTDLKREDTLCFYSTCAWMMWHWAVSSLAVGASVVLYEGNPFYPQKTALFDLIDECDITVFGAGAKIFENAQNFGLTPKKSHKLSTLRTILTTGSPLMPETFDYIYQQVKTNLCLSSISGGSDIISCFALGNPILPVYRGELQCLGLGMDVRIYNDSGQEINHAKGELVCAAPFPSMPLYFWNDPDGQKYQQAYFQRFPGVWTHGDYAQRTAHQGLIIFGRSDSTLNPGGVRIGTAEIYQQVEKLPEILDSLAVGYQSAQGEKIILFVTLKEDQKLNDELIQELKTVIRRNTSPHHVPAKIIHAPDLPRTLNGKLMENLVKKLINHQVYAGTESLANPHILEFFKNLNL